MDTGGEHNSLHERALAPNKPEYHRKRTNTFSRQGGNSNAGGSPTKKWTLTKDFKDFLLAIKEKSCSLAFISTFNLDTDTKINSRLGTGAQKRLKLSKCIPKYTKYNPKLANKINGNDNMRVDTKRNLSLEHENVPVIHEPCY